MVQPDTFRCQLVTPEAAVFDTQVSFVALTAHDGEIGILRNRAPLLCKLGIGELRIQTEQDTQSYYIDGGFAQVLENEVTLLTQKAIAASDIDVAEAEKTLADLRSQIPTGIEEVECRTLEMKRASMKLKLASKW